VSGRSASELVRFLVFAALGALGTLAHYGVLIGLVETGVAAPALATALGAIVGALVNYVLSRRLAFRSTRAHREALPRFLLVAGIGILLNPLLLGAFIAWTGWAYLICQILVTLVLLAVNYAIHSRWTFRASA
jgi:putative flippase GtrA